MDSSQFISAEPRQELLIFCVCVCVCVCMDIFFFFIGPYPWHMEVPSLGVELELQLLAYTTGTAMQDLSVSVTYISAHGNPGSLTH